MWTIDHVFVMTSPGAPDAEVFERAGLSVMVRREHPGQGTANCCFGFEDGYVELLYATDETLLRSPAVMRTGLWERSRWRESGASPLGVCLRGEGERPVPTWEYHAPFLAGGGAIPIAVDPAGPRAAMLFFSVFPRVPGATPTNPGRIMRVRIETPAPPAWGEMVLSSAPQFEIVHGPCERMVVEIDGGRGVREIVPGEATPLVIRL